ncbi:MAG: entericidin A/B family lipoprotein [Sphingomonadales bacterium]|nr:entericidin A/B family lipoprotein [Sphingomonadales bacterium]
MLRKFATTLVLTGLGLAVVACNTVAGAGKDMQSAGSAISTAAK